jgi:hypothetical protein
MRWSPGRCLGTDCRSASHRGGLPSSDRADAKHLLCVRHHPETERSEPRRMSASPKGIRRSKFVFSKPRRTTDIPAYIVGGMSANLTGSQDRRRHLVWPLVCSSASEGSGLTDVDQLEYRNCTFWDTETRSRPLSVIFFFLRNHGVGQGDAQSDLRGAREIPEIT